MSTAQQRTLVQAPDPAGGSVAVRCQALGLARSSFYYQPCGESADNLKLMRLLDAEFTEHNFKGVLGLRDHLRLAGHVVNEKRVRRLVRLMCHEPVYPKPSLSVPGQGVTPYPYLLRDRPATAPNEVWSTDITYVLWPRAFSIWPPCSTGTRATCSAGSSPTRSMWAFACKSWPMPCRWSRPRTSSVPT